MEWARDHVVISPTHSIKFLDENRMSALLCSGSYFQDEKNICKEMLCDWVETVSHIFDVNDSPWLRKAAPLAEEVESMRNDYQELRALHIRKNIIVSC